MAGPTREQRIDFYSDYLFDRLSGSFRVSKMMNEQDYSSGSDVIDNINTFGSSLTRTNSGFEAIDKAASTSAANWGVVNTWNLGTRELNNILEENYGEGLTDSERSALEDRFSRMIFDHNTHVNFPGSVRVGYPTYLAELSGDIRSNNISAESPPIIVIIEDSLHTGASLPDQIAGAMSDALPTIDSGLPPRVYIWTPEGLRAPTPDELYQYISSFEADFTPNGQVPVMNMPLSLGEVPHVEGPYFPPLAAPSFAPATSPRPQARPDNLTQLYSVNGYDFDNMRTPDDLSDDIWIINGQPSERGRLDRTVEQEVQAWENWDRVFGTDRADQVRAAAAGGNSTGSDRDNDRELDDNAKEILETLSDLLESAPIIFDLDGDGIQLTELSNSSHYVDATGDGLQNRTAWAGVGDAVLFYDPDNTGLITEMRQYVFTEWDPTARSDMEALASVFDSNGDGVFDANDAAWADFKLMVTNPDGSTTAMTLGELGIVSIDLMADTTNIELPDGSVITGQASFTRGDGSTGTVGEVTLIAEADGHRLEQVETFAADGTRTEVTTGYAGDGSIAFVNTTVASATANGTLVVNSYDDNGDGVVDRLQTITLELKEDGSTVKTVTNSLGAAAATAILLNKTVTITSADTNSVTIQRDSTGGGWFDQIETRVTATDGSMTIVTTDQGQDGSVIRSVTEDVSADGLSRTEAIDNDGDGVADVTMSHVIVVDADGSRSETVTVYNQDGSVRSATTETISADGQTKTVAHDLDGDGAVDTVEDLDITTGTDGSTSTIVISNGDGSTRSSVTHVQSGDALTKSAASDLDGDGDVDVTTVDDTVINPDDSRVNTVTVTNGDGSIRSMQQTTLGADKVTSETWGDLDRNGVFDATDLVRSVSVDATTGARTATIWDRNVDGSVNATAASVTSADGLSRTTTTDLDGDGDADTVTSDVTTVDGSGAATRVVTTTNQDGSLRSATTRTTSADGLSSTTTTDIDGDGVLDGTTHFGQTNNADGTVTRTTSGYAGDGVTLLSESVSVESEDRRVVTTHNDSNGDGTIDSVVLSELAEDGSRTVTETTYHADGSVAGTQITHVSANGLERTVETDADGNGVFETTSTSAAVLNADGGRTDTAEARNADGSLRNQSVATTSDDGLTVTGQTDADGDGAFERATSSVTSLNADGSTSTLSQVFAENGALLSQTMKETSDDGLIVETSSDTDGDGSYDLIKTTTTTLAADGSTATVSELRDSNGVLRSGSTTTTSDDGRHVTQSVDHNGEGNFDEVIVTIEADDGTVTSTSSQLGADGSLQSQTETVVSANGLETTVSEDRDGDGITDLMMTEATVLTADGSTTQTTTDRDRNGNAYSSATVVISDDGLTTTRSNDYDADGITDLTIVSETDIAADGTQTQTTTRTSADGSTIGIKVVETSADGRTVTTQSDTDGNGRDDLHKTVEIKDDGTRVDKTEYLSTGGVVESTYEVITSGDGLSTTRLTDHNGDGEIDLRSVETSKIGVDGTVTRDVEHRDQHQVLEGRERYVVSDDGMTSTVSLDLDGDGLWDFITETETTYAEDGNIVESIQTRDISADILSEITTTTSGDGLTTETVADYTGDGSVDRTAVTVKGADGGFTSTVHEYGAGYELYRTDTQTVSADGRTSVRTMDLDGDGNIDREVVSTIDLSGNTTTTCEDIQINGAAKGTITGYESANGMIAEYSFDIDGDGTIDVTRITEVTYEDDGDMVTTFTESYGDTLTYSEITTTAADGLSSTRDFDADGDGESDGTTETVTTLNADGSRETLTETHYSDGDLHSSVVETVSADGRTVVREMDYDGNGIADKISETIIAADGSSVETDIAFNEAGIRNNVFTTTTSADGLTTTVMRQGNVQTTTRSVLDNGSYAWDNGIASDAGGYLKTGHSIDAQGVEIWDLSYSKYVVVTPATGDTPAKYGWKVFKAEARLDQTAKERVFTEAESVYDTVLDRGLDTGEREELVRWMDDGQLDKAALIDHLIASGEYTTRYGEMSNAEFLTQTYLNTFGRAPSMAELAQSLTTLSAGMMTRGDIARELADSVEHAVVGNGHLRTNNFDVIMNPAVFERSLDEDYVRGVVESIIDVLYDRDATASEIAYFAERLLDGTDRPDDIVDTLLSWSDRLIQDVPANTLKGLTGEELINQAYLNATGRPATTNELLEWESILSAGTLTNAQFIASLAQSAEHLSDGNAHIATELPEVTVRTGTSGNDTITGGAGQDKIFGLEGNDTLWGKEGSDIIIGGTGDDKVGGFDGADIYIWKKGDGNDIIEDNGTSAIHMDRLVLQDVVSDGLILTNAPGSLDLVITIIETGEHITIKRQYESPEQGYGLESIEFADGVIWDIDDIFTAATETGTTGNDTLWGDDGDKDNNIFGLGGNDTITAKGGNDTLVGGLGDDVLIGGAGADTYIWERGDGADRIEDFSASEANVDTLVLKNMSSDDVTLTRDWGVDEYKNDLLIVVSGPNGDEIIRVSDQFDQPGEGIEKIIFADGVVWTREHIIQLTMLEDDETDGTLGHTRTGLETSDDNLFGLAGDDTLRGLGGDDTLQGGEGNDRLEGGAGSDTYTWKLGDGDDIIDEEDNPDATQIDRLILEDVNSTDVILRREHHREGEQRNDMYIIINDSETIEVFDQFKNNGEGLEMITFADGVTWTRDDIFSRTRLEGTDGDDQGTGSKDNTPQVTGSEVRDNLYGLGGNDTLVGLGGDDWLYGGLGNDTLNGGAGNDTYVWTLGDGNDVIQDTNATSAETDTLILHQVASGDVTMTKSGNDLIVTITATGETITVKNRFNVGTHGDGDGVEFIRFDDGTVVEVLGGELAEMIRTGTSGADTLSGWGLRDTLIGGDGEDTLDGNGGDDTLIGGAGNDSLHGDFGNDTYGWSSGDGNDFIDDKGEDATEIDRLALRDIESDGVTLTRGDGGFDLLITINSTGEVITVDDRFHGTLNGQGIEEIEFADGVVWDLNDILEHTMTYDDNIQNVDGSRYADNLFGDDGDDTIVGFAGDDTLTGGQGADILKGGAGNDTYVWSRGDGLDVINDGAATTAETDTLILTDLNPEDIVLSRANGSDTLTITLQNNAGAAGTTGGMYYEYYQGEWVRSGHGGQSQQEPSIQSISDIPTTGALGAGLSFDSSVLGMDRRHGGNGEIFGVRMAGVINITTAGTYTFSTTSDDGSMLWIDGQLVVNNDGVHGFIEKSGQITLAPGQHTIEISYFNSTSNANLDVSLVGPDTSALTVDLFESGMLGQAAEGLHLLNIDPTEFADMLYNYSPVEIKGQFDAANQGRGIEAIQFADGSVWTLQDILDKTVVEDTAATETLNGTVFADNLYGLAGNDTLQGREGDDKLYGGDGDDTLNGHVGNDVLDGGADNDTLNGGTGEDQLFGGDGDDTLIADGYLDLFDGGAGIDTLNLSSFTSEYVVNLALGTVGWLGNDASSVIAGVENVIGTAGNDIIIGDDGDNRLAGGDGDDRLIGGAGNDVILDGGGDDYLDGGEGIDTLDFRAAYAEANILYDLVAEVISSNDWSETIISFENVLAGVGNDEIRGTDGANVLDGGGGNDRLFGGAGDDVLIGGQGSDYLDGGEGSDTADYSYAELAVQIDLENETLVSSAGLENIISIENIISGSGDDEIFGTGSTNKINGWTGNDTLTGGSGADTFVFKVGDGQDQITDFEDGSDVLDFTGSGLTFADLTITSDADGAAWIFYGTDDSIQLLNAASQIEENDFVFA